MEGQWLRQAINLAKEDDPRGYQQLLGAYAPRLYGYFLRATASHHDAEDLLGELALKLVRTLKMYDDRGRFEPWLFRVAANMVRDRIRRRIAGPVVVGLNLDSDQDQEPPAPANRVDARMVATERATALHKALAKLDETSKEMILLHHFSDLSFKEIARHFGCPLGTALAKVHRGMKMLKNLLDDPDE